jgi:UBA/TS-N domain
MKICLYEKSAFRLDAENLIRFICFFLNCFSVPPEELYATQLIQLQEMGFIDTQENIRALIATSGNVHAAVERLLGNFGL